MRDNLCANRETVPDSELRDISKWTWNLRVNNTVFKDRDSAFLLESKALDAVRQYNNSSDATAFYVLLVVPCAAGLLHV